MKKQMLGMAVAVLMVFGASPSWCAEITSLPYTITTPGSYYITQSLTSTNQNDHNGIVVNTSNVSIDLRGNSLIGNSYSGVAIGLVPEASGIKNIEVMNGTITGFESSNELDSVESVRIINLRIVDNSSSGYVGSNSLIKDSLYAYNGGGTVAGVGSIISGNIVHHSQGNGFAAGGNSNGILYINNTVSNNAMDGIYTGSGCTLINNTAYGNGEGGISVGYGATIKNNTVYGNQNNGITSAGYSLIDGNTAYNNNQSDNSYSDISYATGDVLADNVPMIIQ